MTEEQAGSSTGRSDRAASIAVATLAALGFGTALVWSCLRRNPYYDEFYTWFVTRPDRPFFASLTQSWLTDNHPPLFYSLAWFGGHLAPSIEQLRLINLCALLLALAGGWLVVRRTPGMWVAAAVMFLVLAANESALIFGSDLRSYFLSYCASAVLVLALTTGSMAGELRSSSQRMVLAVALVLAFNLHIITSLVAGALVLPFLAFAGLSGKRTLFRQICVPALAAGAVLAFTTAFQFQGWLANTANFWLPPGLAEAFNSLRHEFQRVLEGNPVVLLAAVAGGGLLIREAWRDRKLAPALQAMLLLGAGIALAVGVILLLQSTRPSVQPRYLAALLPALALGLALGFGEAQRKLPRTGSLALLIVACAATLWVQHGNARRAAGVNSWSGTAVRLGALVRSCPDSPIHIDPAYWSEGAFTLPPADNRMVFPRAHALMAQRNGFVIEPAASRRISPTCPSLFWAEHVGRREWSEAEIRARLTERGFPVTRIWVERFEQGWVASNRPLRAEPVRANRATGAALAPKPGGVNGGIQE